MIAEGIGLGTFPFSNVFSRVTAEEAERIVHAFLDGGGRYIQTAPYYEGVDSLVGSILRSVDRDRFALGTLCVKDRESRRAGSRAAVTAQCEDSLRHLGLDYIDLYLTSTTKATDASFAETIQAMLDLRDQGKVREIGVCNVTLPQLEEYNHDGAVSHVQNRLSLIDQSGDRDVREYCARNGIGLVPYNVIEWGLLTGKALDEWSLRDGDIRGGLPIFGDEPRGVLREWVVNDLRPIAADCGQSIEALAIHWALSQPGVAFCPVGATTVDQITSSLRAAELSGRTDVVSALDDAYDRLVQQVRDKSGKELNEFLRNSYGQ
ncbi:aldo/keto reductase [Actinomadura spongiicola]|nr:aldo/keto reductase [Actinomadura spongiicola]